MRHHIARGAKHIRAFGTFGPNTLQSLLVAAGRRLPRGYLGLRVSGWLRSVLRATAHEPLDLLVLGQRMRLHLDGNATERRLAITPHFFDPEELAVLRKRLRPGFQFVDLGANVGTYSLLVAREAGPGTRVLAVEAHPLALERLRENVMLNGFDVTVAPVAVSDRNGDITLRIDDRNLGATSIHETFKGHGRPREVSVATRPLLDLVHEAGLKRIDALKADIEGVEDRALLPFFQSAPRALWPRLLIVENSADRWHDDLHGELSRLGYHEVVKAKNLVLARA